MTDRWSATQVEALAPDPSSLRAAHGLARPLNWVELGSAEGDPPTVWGLCKGSGAKPYQTCVDLAEPAYKCSCPSRKFPCKHSLALLLLWSAGSVAPADQPAWALEWHAGRAARAEKTATRRAEAPSPPTEAQERAARRRVDQRTDRVSAGLAELDQWLTDQARNGIAGLDRAGYRHFDQMAARLVDAQAGTVAGEVRRLAEVASSGEGWPGRMLSELGLLRLLAQAHRRVDTLPPPMAATVRARVGFTMTTDQVLATPRVRDEWQVTGTRDETDDRIVTRRTWLTGRITGRPALILSFAAPGQALPADLVVGLSYDADLCFFPGGAPVRAVLAQRYGAPVTPPEPAGAVGVAEVLHAYAAALGGDPWLTAWPVLLVGVLVPGTPWRIVDAAGDALVLHPGAGEPWRMLAATGGHPAVFAGEYGPAGLRPLTTYVDGEVVPA